MSNRFVIAVNSALEKQVDLDATLALKPEILISFNKSSLDTCLSFHCISSVNTLNWEFTF
jgi:hypothetical protein